ncbi:MAG TPA: folylpolyglutamate synthase/dihydrofolate synthase family protein, partial [Bacteroidota bacterium]|nr:folylpolyglutamate synthase/dihydrofolate synthase family protein [Bacteroidota bacterium]
QKFGIKLGLENIRRLQEFLGHPENDYPIIHIAGTNGKGSTAAMIASALTASGYRTGLYTSPHLVNFNERIRIDAKEISDTALAGYTAHLKPRIVSLRSTFFEATTAMALKYFSDEQVDIAVLETGLGGRFDATNAVTPILSIITSIGFDHTEYLGNTLEAITSEKAGIIKPGIPCITAVSQSEPLKVIRKACKENRAPLHIVKDNRGSNIIDSTIEGLTLSNERSLRKDKNLFVSLAGEHQAQNAGVALCALELLNEMYGFRLITRRTIHRGLANISRYSGLRGRMGVIHKSPLMIADVAHNPPAVERLLGSLAMLNYRQFITVFGVMKDKDYRSMLPLIASSSRAVFAVTPKLERSLPSHEIVRELHRAGVKCYDGNDVASAIPMAVSECRPDEPILLFGSHLVVGEAMEWLKNDRSRM